MGLLEKDKWNVVFMIPERFFELKVMFFGLINSLAIFQTMTNKILWDLVNTRKVVSCIDNVIVETEEEEYNEIVEEVVKRLTENDLYEKMQVEG